MDLHAMQDTFPWACVSPQVCLSSSLPRGSFAILKCFLTPVLQMKPVKRRHFNALGC